MWVPYRGLRDAIRTTTNPVTMPDAGSLKGQIAGNGHAPGAVKVEGGFDLGGGNLRSVGSLQGTLAANGNRNAVNMDGGLNMFCWPCFVLPCTITPCTLNTGNGTCKSNIQHCNTLLTGVCVWELASGACLAHDVSDTYASA